MFILGTMNIEYPYTSTPKVNKTENYYQSIIESYCNLELDQPILDTAYYYGNTKTERILGNILNRIPEKKIQLATKANPWFNNDFTSGKFGQLSRYNLERQLTVSLENLQKEGVETFFLHCPDPETPIHETLDTCDELWRKEKFNTLGISNFSMDQIIEIMNVCETHGYESPQIYQGMYNVLSRRVEEIFPLLNDYGVDFWAYNPLAGGLLTGKYSAGLNAMESDCRFKDNGIYQSIFWKPEVISKVQDMRNYGNAIELSLQWLKHHSCLREEDKIILGVSTIEQLEINSEILMKNIHNSSNVVEFLNSLHDDRFSPNYFY